MATRKGLNVTLIVAAMIILITAFTVAAFLTDSISFARLLGETGIQDLNESGDTDPGEQVHSDDEESSECTRNGGTCMDATTTCYSEGGTVSDEYACTSEDAYCCIQ